MTSDTRTRYEVPESGDLFSFTHEAHYHPCDTKEGVVQTVEERDDGTVTVELTTQHGDYDVVLTFNPEEGTDAPAHLTSSHG